MSHRIEVQNVSIVYPNGHHALVNANLKLRSGTICGLIGMNGSGKSTLFKSIMGLLKPYSGDIRINGHPIRDAQKQGVVAYVPQSEDVDWNFPVTVWDVVMMGRYGRMGLLRTPSRKDREMVQQALKRVNLLEFKDRQIGELSGGQKKRVFVARALAQEATVLLLDEPFSGVDATTEELITGLLKDLKALGHTILISTHHLESIEAFCDEVALIAHQTVFAHGRTTEVFTPENIAQVFGAQHLLQPRIVQSAPRVALGD
ncbi:metal ABC transporter ATP-binding protein [Deinococcus cellulosilyticus]|uniref:Manganese transporter n=1 Tax=Deinococcus cellulosilyticus (strain DSM 18568 / NBRC 106333 / KACC 11606 / 5516J-15) TaxID=1223518 RepID=A0A511N8F1_DEIC1|nr:metal ABC transporter ATP-binding protein [Deinococcus cellulosilyticus]GEM48756.1 manganese transporter [Deinococcus cellulosilyticus NBRC 106333 = KACC 11606]